VSWDDRLCIGRLGVCEGYRGAPCDCFGPWTPEELADARGLLAGRVEIVEETVTENVAVITVLDPLLILAVARGEDGPEIQIEGCLPQELVPAMLRMIADEIERGVRARQN